MNRTNKKQGKYFARRQRRGVAIVEFALLMPILLAILLGIIEFGWLIMHTYSVGNATREGARYGALGKTQDDTRTRVKQTSNSVAITDSEINLEYFTTSWQTDWPADNSLTGKNGVPVDSQLRVRVATPHISLTGFFPFLRNRIIIQSTVMRREL